MIENIEKIKPENVEITYLHFKENPFCEGKNHLIIPEFKWLPLGRASFRKFIYLPFVLRKYKFDVVHDLYHICPFLFPLGKYKKVLTVFDLTPKLFPKFHEGRTWIQPLIFPFVFRNVDKIIAISNSTKNDLLDNYKFLKKEKIDVVHLATRKKEFKIQSSCQIICHSEHIRSAQCKLREESKDILYYTKRGSFTAFRMTNLIVNSFLDNLIKLKIIEEKYILFVSTIEPRKNLPCLIKAYDIFRSKGFNYKLVLIGKKGWKWEESFQAIENSKYKNDIIWKDYVSDDELAKYYKNASLFVYPSFYEGFGLPVLEALGYGIPVITSNNSSLPEVGGDAAIYFETNDEKDLADKMKLVLSDEKLKRELIEKAKMQSEKFSWEKTAVETLEIYESFEC